MLTVVPLPLETDETATLVAALEACLADAKAGNTQSFVLVTVKRDGSVLRAHAMRDRADTFKLLGVMAHEVSSMSATINATREATDHLNG